MQAFLDYVKSEVGNKNIKAFKKDEWNSLVDFLT
jgi:hypothetical protein